MKCWKVSTFFNINDDLFIKVSDNKTEENRKAASNPAGGPDCIRLKSSAAGAETVYVNENDTTANDGQK